MQFFRTLFAVIIGIFLAGFIVFLLFVGLIVAVTSQTVNVPDKAIFRLTLDKPIVERSWEDPLSEFDLPMSQDVPVGVIDIIERIGDAKTDERIKGIYLELSSVQAGFASLAEIRNALTDFKTSGKFVYAYGETYSEGAYYIASVADSVFLNPRGYVEFDGLRETKVFVKGALEKLGVKAEIFRVGEFKSAVEIFQNDKMSDANREQTNLYLQTIYNQFLLKVGPSINKSKEDVAKISSEMLVRNAKTAVSQGLVHRLAYYDEVETVLRNAVGLEEKDKLPFIGIMSYTSAKDSEKKDNDDTVDFNKAKIAVIIAEGEIVSGKGDENTIGSDKISEYIRKARKDEKIKAIVLRINSPGGSALASDVIWREVSLARKEKPVIASMSDVAASGGYYIAMAANKIVAQPTTITGSIGIFSVYFDTKSLFNDKLGITFDEVKTGTYSDLGSSPNGLSDSEKKIIQTMVEEGYETFTQQAATDRNMAIDSLLAVASGRVWAGEDALSRKLVDQLGGFQDALKLAAEQAGIAEGEYRTVYYQDRNNLFDSWLDGTSVMSALFAKELPGGRLMTTPAKQLEKLTRMQGLQARLPYDLVIE